MTKRCTKCGIDKPLDDYYAMRRGKHGRNSWCKSCMAVARREWRLANGDRQRATALAWRRANPARVRAIYIKTTYGLTPEQREALGDVCHVCARPATVVDHDHACCPGYRSCGQCVRGVLCRTCNLALGHFADDIDRLRSAVAYLEKVHA